MKDSREISPPRWATRVLSWYCKPELLEDLQGDLNEYFRRNVTSKGVRYARFIYVLDVLKFFRFYTVRKPEFINVLIHWIMIGSYIKTSGRSIVRNKLFSVINIVGLAVSMSVALLVIAMLSDVNSYDKFHKQYGDIYRVIDRYEFNGKKDDSFLATTSPRAAMEIKENFTGVKDVAILYRDFGGDITVGEKTLPLHGLWADEGLFKVFSFRLLQGDAATALKNPFSVVLTERSARKLFGDVDALGRTITLHRKGNGPDSKDEARDYTVTGVLQDVPVFSHMKFDMLGSWSTRAITEVDNKREMAWDNVWSTWVYVVLPNKHDVDAFLQNLRRLAGKEDKTVKYTHVEFDLQPLSD
ncbi:MAG TPA: permease prefix domain 2-containing transporter, partial [Chryseosolibacter sp.]|nr:permease prefix domain 2-containing transporter [Chryseosolibacter sp.]